MCCDVPQLRLLSYPSATHWVEEDERDMPRAALIPESKVRRLVHDGLGNEEIRRRLLEEDHVQVTAAAISVFRSRHDLPAAPGRYSELLPWRVKREHNQAHAAKMLRTESRVRNGEELTDPLLLNRHKSFMRRLKDADAVVHYDPETPQGFWLVPRRYGADGTPVDRDVIRDPAVQ